MKRSKDMSKHYGPEEEEHDSDWEPSDDYYYEHAGEFVDGWDPNDDSNDYDYSDYRDD